MHLVADQCPMKSAGKFRIPLLSQNGFSTEMLQSPCESQEEEVPHYLASVTTSQKDQNSSWSNRGPQPPLVLAKGLFAVTQKLARNIFSRVVSGLEKEEQKCCTTLYSTGQKAFTNSLDSSFYKRYYFPKDDLSERFFLCCNQHFRNTPSIFCTIMQQRKLTPALYSCTCFQSSTATQMAGENPLLPTNRSLNYWYIPQE